MISIVVPEQDVFDNATQQFYRIDKPQRIDMEHSLISLSKWESKWKKPFISLVPQKRTREETLDYLRCMTINKNVDPLVYNVIPNRVIDKINEYIEESRTATKFYTKERTGKQEPKKAPKEITSEYLYAQMVKFGIPFEPCEKWHLTRLITLIKACAIENGPQDMMNKKDLMNYHRSLNASRRKSRPRRH